MMKERIRLIHTLLKKELAEAPEDDRLTYDERDMYAEMQNLKESLEKVHSKIFLWEMGILRFGRAYNLLLHNS